MLALNDSTYGIPVQTVLADPFLGTHIVCRLCGVVSDHITNECPYVCTTHNETLVAGVCDGCVRSALAHTFEETPMFGPEITNAWYASEQEKPVCTGPDFMPEENQWEPCAKHGIGFCPKDRRYTPAELMAMLEEDAAKDDRRPDSTI